MFIHSAVCLTKGPHSLPKPVFHTVPSSASSFNLQHPLFSLRSCVLCPSYKHICVEEHFRLLLISTLEWCNWSISRSPYPRVKNRFTYLIRGRVDTRATLERSGEQGFLPLMVSGSLYPRVKNRVTHWIRGWVDTGAALDRFGEQGFLPLMEFQ